MSALRASEEYFTHQSQKPTVVMMPVTKKHSVSRSKFKHKPRRWKGTHFAVVGAFVAVIIAQLIMTQAQLVSLHYEIEQINYHTTQIETEKKAYYQHQAELSKLSKLKEAVANEGAVSDSSRVFRISGVK